MGRAPSLGAHPQITRTKPRRPAQGHTQCNPGGKHQQGRHGHGSDPTNHKPIREGQRIRLNENGQRPYPNAKPNHAANTGKEKGLARDKRHELT